MARFRSSLALRPINRIKHVIDDSAALANATNLPKVIVLATDTPTLAVEESVITGSKIHGFYLKLEVVSNEDEVGGAVPNVYMAIQKNPGGNLDPIQANAVGNNDNKRFIIHQEMVMIQNINGGNPRVLFNGVIKIPKGYQRFGPNDTLTVNLFSPSIDILYCMQVHYKEFR